MALVLSASAQKLQRYFYPNMSGCGGALYGLYDGEKLVRIESTYGAEFGYSKKNIEFVDGLPVKIEYIEHFAQYEKYNEAYPDEEYIDPDKLTYEDKRYLLTLSNEVTAVKYIDGNIVDYELSEELKERLLYCARQMKEQLEDQKVLQEKK